jgi:hypothetical protein
MCQTAIQRPRTDDRPLWDIFFALRGYPAVLIAHEMKLFQLLGEGSKTLNEVCRSLTIARRPAEALLAVSTSLGFIWFRDGKYSLTPIGEDYLLPSSPTYYGHYFDAFLQNSSFASLRDAVMNDRPQGRYSAQGNPFAAWHAEEAQSFTRAMHSASFASALAWPTHIDLSSNEMMLDIGGGSGAHAIGAVSTWPRLRAVILDKPAVCGIAKSFIERYELETRITTHSADFFSDAFPAADVHFYGMVFHDWPEAKCRLLARKSFDALQSGGRIIIHEMLFNDDRTGPFAAAAFNVDMLLGMPGEQYSGPQIVSMLSDARFVDIKVVPTFGYWSIVSGSKA